MRSSAARKLQPTQAMDMAYLPPTVDNPTLAALRVAHRRLGQPAVAHSYLDNWRQRCDWPTVTEPVAHMPTATTAICSYTHFRNGCMRATSRHDLVMMDHRSDRQKWLSLSGNYN